MRTIKALTVCQPYAALIVRGAKRIENRKWATGYRGPLAIHAGLSEDWLGTWPYPVPKLLYGAVVGVAKLVGCVRVEPLRRGEFDDRHPGLSDDIHAEGPWCWILEDAVEWQSPFLCKGARGLWEVELP